jgi:Lrp/AsnC family transcriptional regulator for asnA, asnC and gidA
MKKFDDLYYLDQTDKQILKALTDNARAMLTEIAEQTDRSRVSVFRRIGDMEEVGVISGYTVLVDWDKVGNKR